MPVLILWRAEDTNGSLPNPNACRIYLTVLYFPKLLLLDMLFRWLKNQLLKRV